MPVTIGGKYSIIHQQINKKKHSFKISGGDEESIVVDTYKDMVSINLHHASSDNFAASSGLMGDFSTGDSLARDGATIINESNLFGQEWQVSETDLQLFPTPSPHANKGCLPPSTTKASSRRRLSEATIPEEAVQKACAHLKDADKRQMCMLDVMAMDDTEVPKPMMSSGMLGARAQSVTTSIMDSVIFRRFVHPRSLQERRSACTKMGRWKPIRVDPLLAPRPALPDKTSAMLRRTMKGRSVWGVLTMRLAFVSLVSKVPPSNEPLQQLIANTKSIRLRLGTISHSSISIITSKANTKEEVWHA